MQSFKILTQDPWLLQSQVLGVLGTRHGPNRSCFTAVQAWQWQNCGGLQLRTDARVSRVVIVLDEVVAVRNPTAAAEAAAKVGVRVVDTCVAV
jgi:hypothetical protein